MVASQKWIEAAADLIEERLGAKAGFELIADLCALPNANKSAEQTLLQLRAKLSDRSHD